MNRMTTTRSSKQAPLNSGTLSPNPWDLSLSGQNADAKLGGTRTEGRAPQGCDLSAVPSAEMATGGLDAEATQTPKQRPVQTLAYCGQKMVLTMGSTLLVEPEPTLAGALPVPSFTPLTFLQIPENLIWTRVISLTSAGIARSLFPDGQAHTVTFGTSLAHHKFCRPGS